MRAMMRLITQNIYNQNLFIKEHKIENGCSGFYHRVYFFNLTQLNSTQSDYSPIIT